MSLQALQYAFVYVFGEYFWWLVAFLIISASALAFIGLVIANMMHSE